MRIDEQQHLAEVVERCRRTLAEASTDGSASPGAVQEAVARLADAVNALQVDVAQRRRRSLALRLRQWSTPRLGTLAQHAPRPLRVPAHYLRTNPPRPAPTISIVTPSYNQGEFLERTLYSVLGQAYPALEYVVADGASQDGSTGVLRRYADRLVHWDSQPDRGQASAINRGFAHTSGEIMAYLNSDDLLLPGSLAYVASYFARHPGVDAVYGHRLVIDKDDRQIGVWVLPAHDDRALAWQDFVPQETLFWRRRAWDRVGGAMDESFAFALDWDLLLRMRAAGCTFVRLPRFLGAFRVHQDQKTGKDGSAFFRECERLRERVHGWPAGHDEATVRVRSYLRHHTVHHTAHRLVDRLPLPRETVRTLPLPDWV